MNNYVVKKLAGKFSSLFYLTGVSFITSKIYGGNGHILMFHRVIPHNNKHRIHNHQSLEITPEHLEKIILYYNKKGYECLSLDEFYERMIIQHSFGKYVIYTFDDGYYDNLKYALPVFEKYNKPFTIYVTTSFPDKTALLWWYALEDLLINNKVLDLSFFGADSDFKCDDMFKKELAFNYIRSLINSNSREMMIRFFNSFHIDLLQYAQDLCLSWDNLREMSKNPLVTIGAHTVNHVALKELADEHCRYEMEESKRIIERELNIQVDHFSYPFGKKSEVGRREFKIAKEIGFKSCTTTRLGAIFLEHKDFMESLPRLSMNSMMDGVNFNLLVSGFYSMLRNRFKRIVTE